MSDSREVIGFLARTQVSVMLLDLRMPNIDGERLLADICQLHPEVVVIIATGVDDLRTAVSCIRLGAFDYLVKPIDERHLLTTVRRTLEVQELRAENARLNRRFVSSELVRPEAFSDIVAVNPEMREIFRYIEAISESPFPVLVTGETGVGKELIARAIHKTSGRKGPFVPVNAAGLDGTVFTDTLFGHRRGAFTGADTSRRGLVAQAEDGTLFLHCLQQFAAAREHLRGSIRSHLPLHITEYNTSYSPRSPVHDTAFNAAYLGRVLSEGGDWVDSFSYWTFSDMFEENGVPQSMFHGGSAC